MFAIYLYNGAYLLLDINYNV